jgi:hypothetical protein
MLFHLLSVFLSRSILEKSDYSTDPSYRKAANGSATQPKSRLSTISGGVMDSITPSLVVCKGRIYDFHFSNEFY